MENITEELICEYLKEWINHTKEGFPRAEKDLIKFDVMWNFIANIIKEVELIEEKNEEQNDLLKMVKYTGKLYRFHKKYDERKTNFGIKETNHFVSWSKSNNIDDFYWLNEEQKFIIITVVADDNKFGIDLVGLSDYMQKYCFDNFKLGSPAILREQEVVFPIDCARFCNIELNPVKSIIKPT